MPPHFLTSFIQGYSVWFLFLIFVVCFFVFFARGQEGELNLVVIRVFFHEQRVVFVNSLTVEKVYIPSYS